MQLCLLSAIGYIPAELEAFEYGDRFHGEPPMKIQARARYAPGIHNDLKQRGGGESLPAMRVF
jgi:hypothetical protein